MKISKMTIGMGRTMQGAKQYENYKPFTSIEVEVGEEDDLQDVKKFMKDHLHRWQAEVEADVESMINGSPRAQQLGQPQSYAPVQQQYPPPWSYNPQGPFPVQQVPHPPTAPVNGPFPPPPAPVKPNVAQMFNHSSDEGPVGVDPDISIIEDWDS